MASLTSTTVILSNMLTTAQVDGSETGETIPLRPLIQKQRKVDFIIAYDSGGDGDNNWVNGTVLLGVYFRPIVQCISLTKSKTPQSLPHKQASRFPPFLMPQLWSTYK